MQRGVQLVLASRAPLVLLLRTGDHNLDLLHRLRLLALLATAHRKASQRSDDLDEEAAASDCSRHERSSHGSSVEVFGSSSRSYYT